MSRTSVSDQVPEICLFISFVCNAILVAATVFSNIFRNFHLFALGGLFFFLLFPKTYGETCSFCLQMEMF